MIHNRSGATLPVPSLGPGRAAPLRLPYDV